MAKKIVRGITDVKTINNQDFDTNNVNDLLSDGQYNYIHRKKGKDEEYHNLTDNIKTISSDNTELLSVTNNNKTTNTATLHPKHDAQKEQVLESTRNTVTIHHGTNGTAEKTTVDTNPQKVLEHENLVSTSEYITIEHEEASNTSEIKTDKLVSKLNELDNKIPTSAGGRNLALGTSADWSNGWTGFNGQDNQLFIIYRTYNRGFKIGDKVNVRIVLKYSDIAATEGQRAGVAIRFRGNVTDWGKGQLAGNDRFWFDESDGEIEIKSTTVVDEYTLKNDYWEWHLRSDYVKSGKIQWKEAKVEVGDLPTPWSPAPEDIYTLLAKKQDKLTAGTGITIQGQTISASGGGETSTIQELLSPDGDFTAIVHVITSGQKKLITYSFECFPGTAEHVITGELKQKLEEFFPMGSYSNGALTITHDGDTEGTTMKLINSAPSQNVRQHATFTFYESTGGGGGGVHPS